MPTFGCLTNPTVDILKEIETIARLKFDFVEIGMEEPKGKPDILNKRNKKILDLLKKKNLFAIGHFLWWAELGTTYDPVRNAWINECKKAIKICNKLGIKKLTVHLHSRGMSLRNEDSKKVILDNYVRSLKELVDYSKKFDVNIMLENAVEKPEITSLKDFRYIIDRVVGIKVHLDIGHAFIWGGMNNIRNFILAFENRIEHVHLHDNHGKSDEHLPIGRGKINWNVVVNLFKKINYDKTITLEVFSKNRKDVVKSREKIKRLWSRHGLS